MTINTETFIIADTHFAHANILKYEPQRKVILGDKPDWKLIERWNDVVGEGDSVFHLGDFAWKAEDIIKYSPYLNGKKYLLRGNHDKGAQIYLDNGFEEVIDFSAKGEAAYYIEEIGGSRILFSHYPIISDGYDDVHWRFLSQVFDRELCDINIHGHLHSMQLNEQYCINASVEAIGFAPIRLKDLLEQHTNKWKRGEL